jgi:hypothetical protein
MRPIVFLTNMLPSQTKPIIHNFIFGTILWTLGPTPAVPRLVSEKGLICGKGEETPVLQKKMFFSSIPVPFAQQGGSCAPAAARMEPGGTAGILARGRWAEKEEVVEAADPARPRHPHPPHA